MDGSSPLTRGKHQTDRVRIHSRGLIPAHAGKTRALALKGRSSEAHPRSRGENRRATTIGSQRGGSSPLTRGKLLLGGVCHCRVRLIPAHAGKTRTLWPGNHAGVWLIPAHAGKTGARRRSVPRGAAHPRSRGENFFSVVSVIVVSGSSPLTRGKPAPYGPATMPASGSSPLTRGKRRGRPGGRSCVLAHPRSRGENV